MKTTNFLRPTPAPGPGSRRGVALISVLAIVVLMTALVVGFLLRATNEKVATSNYDATSNTRLLADTTVNLVQASINEATTIGARNISLANRTAWASQPGAIRVFDTQGNLQKIYRLYSAPELVSATTTGNILQSDRPPADWASSPSQWVDLNAPVTVSGMANASDHHLVFPILDPRDPSVTSPDPDLSPGVTTKLDGFSIAGAPGVTTLQPAPMPVRWLYVLQNGNIVPPGAGSSSTIAAIPGASASNPIVGRIAFWTDDETSKVNINTAAGSRSVRNGKLLPAPWDLPRFRSYEERQLFSDDQPVQGEYQRYPGHPANTDLSGILNAVGASIGNYPTNQTASGTASPFFKLLPKYNDDYGSKGGTVNTTTSNVQTPVTAKIDRLYTSVGEMLYDKTRNQNGLNRSQLESAKFFLTARSRSPEANLFGMPKIAIWPIDSDYGTNPVPANTTKLVSTYDKVIAFCSTIGTGAARKLYYFQRHDSTSPTNDYTKIPRNGVLYNYLKTLTSADIPGFGQNFASKYSVSNERDQILTEMLDYIRSSNLYDHSIVDPTTGGAYPRFTPKFSGAASGQVVPLKIGTTRGLGRMYTVSEIGLQIICTADGNGKLPSDNGSASDWRSASNLPVDGNLKDAAGAAMAFTKNPTLADTYGGTGIVLTPGHKRLQAMLLFELAAPMLGFDPIKPDMQIKITGLTGISIGTLTPFPNAVALTESMGDRTNYVQQVGGINGFQYFMTNVVSGSQTRRSGWSDSSTGGVPYRFVSNPFTLPSNTDGSGTMSISSGPLTVEILVKDKDSSAYVTVQTFNVQFPATTAPLPDLMQFGLKIWNPSTSLYEDRDNPKDWWGFDQRVLWVSSSAAASNTGTGVNYLGGGCVIRIDPATSTPSTPVSEWTSTTKAAIPLVFYKGTNGTKTSATAMPPSDVVKTLIVKDGDVRLAMAQETVDATGGTNSTLTKHPGYDDTAYKLANSFTQMSGSNFVPGADLGGKLVPGTTYDAAWVPKVPSSSIPGIDWDWDSALPGVIDGAYANKVDEGNIYTSGSSSPYFNGENQANSNTVANIQSYFSPNRIMPSPVMFGSLPTGVKEGIAWRTLLFRPVLNPALNRPRDAIGPKDHLFLDLFTMPVVEPYAISEPFSTAGKVNMNYQIVPFTYINRSTGVRAVLGSELVARVPKAAADRNSVNRQPYYKIPFGNRPGTAEATPSGGIAVSRLPLNLSETNGTLRQFKEKFDAWNIFRSASEICDIYLVPDGYTWTSDNAADTSWYGPDFSMAGDNVRERPYANIYPRLTTKSNTFTVHYKVQSLKNPLGSKPNEWNEQRGTITGEYQGSTTLERYLNPNNNDIPDYAVNPTDPSLETYYQWRVISNTAFSP